MQVHRFISGSFRSTSLFLLSFTPPSPESGSASIEHLSTVPANGPHQYIAQRGDRVYTTSWALPPSLACWSVEGENVSLVGEVPITATSSYISIPPPYTHIYSMGGPTGEIHAVDPQMGAFGEKVQEVLFVKEEELEGTDKTRKALRYGSHAIEISVDGLAFVPVLGTNSIEMYTLSHPSSTFSSSQRHLTHIHSHPSPRPSDGPRHLLVHPNGKRLYVVTEHTNYLDVYSIHPTSSPPSLTHLNSVSIIPTDLRPNPHDFRGDTLALHPPTPSNPSPSHIFATTRGARSGVRGWMGVWELDGEGDLIKPEEGDSVQPSSPSPVETSKDPDIGNVHRYETPTSGGKANAISLLLKRSSLSSSSHPTSLEFDTQPPQNSRRHAQMPLVPPPFEANPPVEANTTTDAGEEQDGLWILLTDDCGGKDEADEEREGCGAGVRVLDWTRGEGVRGVVAEWPSHGHEDMRGGSHAVWLD